VSYFACSCGCSDWKIKDGDKVTVVCKNCGRIFNENLFVYRSDLDLWEAEDLGD